MKREPLTKEEIERLISDEVINGLQYVYGTDQIAAERDRNWEYNMGVMNDLPAPAGRSNRVDMCVHEYIGMMVPSIHRIFTAGRNIVEYITPREELQPITKLVTRYINDIQFRKDNRGELLLLDWLKDGLIQKVGVVKGYWCEKSEINDKVYENLRDDEFIAIVQDVQANGNEIVEHTEVDVQAVGPMGEPIVSKAHTIKVRVKTDTSTVQLDQIPPEEFIISRDARTLEDAVLVGHRTGMMVGDLIEMGFDPEIVSNLPTYTDTYPDRQAKYNMETTQVAGNRDSSADPSLRKVLVIQGILKCNLAGDGVKPWFFTAGGDLTSIKLLEIEEYKTQVFFADFCPEPLPHMFYGRCPADGLAELQKTNTVLLRQALDNLYLSNTPQREVVADLIMKPDQLMNMAPGAPIMVKSAGAIREIAVPFVAQYAFTALEYFGTKAEMRSGVSRQSVGLDADALRNQSATSAQLAYSASMGRVELIARIMAQGGMRKMFKGIFDCMVEYNTIPRQVTNDNTMQTIPADAWKALQDVDIVINTGLGTGNRDRDAAALDGILAQQREIVATLGPQNPIVNLDKITRTLLYATEARGISNPDSFFADPKGWTPPPPPEPKATPDTVELGNVERYKADLENGRGELKIKLEAQGDALKEANRHAEAKLGLANDQQQIQVAAAKALGELENKQAELDKRLQ